jgi:hypothetical protein
MRSPGRPSWMARSASSADALRGARELDGVSPVGRWDHLGDDREGDATDATLHLPAPRRREDDGRRLEADAAVAPRDPGPERRGGRIEPATSDGEPPLHASCPRKLGGEAAVALNVVLVRPDDPSWVESHPEPAVSMTEPARLAWWVVAVRQGDGAGRRQSVGRRKSRRAHGALGRSYRRCGSRGAPHRVLVGRDRARGEQQDHERSSGTHVSRTPPDAGGFPGSASQNRPAGSSEVTTLPGTVRGTRFVWCRAGKSRGKPLTSRDCGASRLNRGLARHPHVSRRPPEDRYPPRPRERQASGKGTPVVEWQR